jgi:O-antigen ligase
MVAMMIALFVSRALLSSSMIAFIAISFFHRDIGKQLRDFFSKPLLWGITLLFFFPLLSGLWSSDIATWKQSMQVKLPLLLLPLAFAGNWNFSNERWRLAGYIFLTIIMIATGWTIANYAGAAQEINEWYLQARTMTTPLGNDHVRFSWLTAVAVLLSGYYAFLHRRENRKLAVVFMLVSAWLIIFLHILAARTGLLSVYIIMGGTAIWMISRKLDWRRGMLLLILLILLPVLAYKLVPSFHNRVEYIRYEMAYFGNAGYLPGSNDAVRVISMKAGWSVMMNNHVKGTGFGDIINETGEWYNRHYPGMEQRDRIYPSSQWLVYGSGNGIPGFIVFSFCMLLPFLVKTKMRPGWWLLNTIAACAFLFDIGLEVQFGVFIYSFVILWWYKWLMRSE